MWGEYQVVGSREFRGHSRGTIFEARLDPAHEARAIKRGDITLLRRVDLSVRNGSYRLPDGWLSPAASENTEAPMGASFIEGGG